MLALVAQVLLIISTANLWGGWGFIFGLSLAIIIEHVFDISKLTIKYKIRRDENSIS